MTKLQHLKHVFIITVIICLLSGYNDIIELQYTYILLNFIMNFSVGASIYFTSHLITSPKIKETENTFKKAGHLFFWTILSTFFGLFLGQILSYLTGSIDTLFFLGKMAYIGSTAFAFLVTILAFTYYTLRERLELANQAILEQEKQKKELEILKARAELEALQSKINPHFLFNALNSIAGLISIDPEKAEEMTVKLAQLFRSTLKFNESSFCTIEEEVNILKTYLDIEKIRFGDRLSYSVSVDEELKQILIPQLLIQPLVENAIKHGIEPLLESGDVRISVIKEPGNIRVRVSDNGIGFNGNPSFGYGLTNISQRLKNLYGSNHVFEISSFNGVDVELRIPATNVELGAGT